MTYQPKVYRDTGGNRQVTASGGEQKVESGGIVTHDAGSLTDATLLSGSGRFRARRSAADTFVVYRLS